MMRLFSLAVLLLLCGCDQPAAPKHQPAPEQQPALEKQPAPKASRQPEQTQNASGPTPSLSTTPVSTQRLASTRPTASLTRQLQIEAFGGTFKPELLRWQIQIANSGKAQRLTTTRASDLTLVRTEGVDWLVFGVAPEKAPRPSSRQLTPAQLQSLVAAIDNAQFFELNRRYGDGDDMGSDIKALRIRLGSQSALVRVDRSGRAQGDKAVTRFLRLWRLVLELVPEEDH